VALSLWWQESFIYLLERDPPLVTKASPPPVRTSDSRSERERPGTALPAALRTSRTALPGLKPRSLPCPEPSRSRALPTRFPHAPAPTAGAPEHPEPRSRSAPKLTRTLPENEAQKVFFFWFFLIFFLSFWLCAWALGRF
jgi:hypothetical protein